MKRSRSDRTVTRNAEDCTRAIWCFCQTPLSAFARWKGPRSAGDQTQSEQRGNHADPETAMYPLNPHAAVHVKEGATGSAARISANTLNVTSNRGHAHRGI